MDLSGDTVGIRLVLVVVCLGLSAFFSSSETALTTVNLIRMQILQTMAIRQLAGY